MATHAALKQQFSRLCSARKADQKEALNFIKDHFKQRLNDKAAIEASLKAVAQTLAEGDAAAGLLKLLDSEDKNIQENCQAVLWFITGCFEPVPVIVEELGEADHNSGGATKVNSRLRSQSSAASGTPSCARSTTPARPSGWSPPSGSSSRC